MLSVVGAAATYLVGVGLISGLLYTRLPVAVVHHGLPAAVTVHDEPVSGWKTASDGFMQLEDLERSGVAVNTLVRLDMERFNAYWTGELNSKWEPPVRVPIYPAYNTIGQGYFLCPTPGNYSLTIRIPVPFLQNETFTPEPPICFIYRSMAQIWENWQVQVPTHEYAQTMIETCAAREETKDQWDGRTYIGPDAPVVLGHKDSVVFQAEITCGHSQLKENIDHQLDQLVDKVYGPYRKSYPDNGMNSLGYWHKDTKVGLEIGSPSYQPQPEQCSETFHPTIFVNTHQGVCGSQSTEPSFRWTPYSEKREEWLLDPSEVQTCLSLPFRVYGDSIGHQFRRGVDCIARGYAGLEDGQYRPTEVTNLMLDILPIFAPSEYVPEYSDEQLDGMLFRSIPEQGEIELWAIGMWVVSYIPSQDWTSGLHAIMARIQARSQRYGTRPVFTLMSSPSSEPVFFAHIYWQTAARARKWNEIVQRAASIYDIPLVDTFFPTVHRFDARIDNVHSCDVLNMETSMAALRAICLQDTLRQGKVQPIQRRKLSKYQWHRWSRRIRGLRVHYWEEQLAI